MEYEIVDLRSENKLNDKSDETETGGQEGER